MAVRDDRSDVRQTTAGFQGPLKVQSLTSAKSKFLSLIPKRARLFACLSLTENRCLTVSTLCQGATTPTREKSCILPIRPPAQ